VRVHVDVHQAGSDQTAGHGDRLPRPLRWQARRHRGDLPAQNRHIAHAIDIVRRIDHVPALQDQIIVVE
jgi:hypothetical protein